MKSQQLLQIQDFFDKTIDVKDFAKYMRRLNHVVVTQHLSNDTDMYKDWIVDGHFWLNDFLETIDPNLQD